MSVQATPLDLRSEATKPRQHVGWFVLGAASYFLLGLLGRTTIREGEELSLVWPAAGAAMLLFGLTAARCWLLVSALVAIATVGFNLPTGATWTQIAIFVVSNVSQAICAVLILRVLAPQLRGAGGDQPFEQPRDFWPIMAASVLGSLIGAVVRGPRPRNPARQLVLDGLPGVVGAQRHRIVSSSSRPACSHLPRGIDWGYLSVVASCERMPAQSSLPGVSKSWCWSW